MPRLQSTSCQFHISRISTLEIGFNAGDYTVSRNISGRLPRWLKVCLRRGDSRFEDAVFIQWVQRKQGILEANDSSKHFDGQNSVWSDCSNLNWRLSSNYWRQPLRQMSESDVPSNKSVAFQIEETSLMEGNVSWYNSKSLLLINLSYWIRRRFFLDSIMAV